MKELNVSWHLDNNCPGEFKPDLPNSKSRRKMEKIASFSSLKPSQPPERLPALNYSMLKDPALRKKLADLGIPSHGNRQMLERRHKEWLTIWNANCDSANPKKKSELKRDLDIWERAQGTLASSTSRAAVLGSQIKDKDFDGEVWAAKHDDSFRDLIARARRSRDKVKGRVTELPTEAAMDTHVEGPLTKSAVVIDPEMKQSYASSSPKDPNPLPKLLSSHEVYGRVDSQPKPPDIPNVARNMPVELVGSDLDSDIIITGSASTEPPKASPSVS